VSLWSLRSAWSVVGSAGSILSVGSAGSILSVGSAGSILSVGSAGSILSVGSAGSILSAHSSEAILCRNGRRMTAGEVLVHVATLAGVAVATGAMIATVIRCASR